MRSTFTTFHSNASLGSILEYLQAFKELNIELAGEFIVMAANLIYLKSRSLLPIDQQPPEEDAEEDDPRWDLIRQLIEYKKFKEAAAELHLRELEQERIFAREGSASSLLQGTACVWKRLEFSN